MTELPTYILERSFDAPRELVWRTWTEPELLARWYGPRVETIVHRFIEDETSAINALLAGEIDMIITVQGAGLDRVPSVIADDKFKIWEPGPIGINHLFLNPKSPQLQDIRVRQAIAYSVDREAVILGAVGGFGMPICEIVVPATVPWNAEYCPYPYDPAKARELLKEAGKSDLTIDFPFTTVAEHPAVKEIIEATFAEAGISLKTRAMDLATFLAQVYSPKTGDYEVSNITSSSKAEAYICKGGRQPLGMADSPVCLDEFDALATKSDTIVDPQEYAEAMQQMTKLLADSAWVIPIFAKLPPTLVRADLEGFKSNRMLMEMDARKLHWAD